MSVLHLASVANPDSTSEARSWLWFPGWSFAPSVFECLYTHLPGEHFGIDVMCAGTAQASLQDAADDISHQLLPPNAFWVGWSMGGLLAQQVRANLVEEEHPKALIALASSPHFCTRPHWPHGLDERARQALTQQVQDLPVKGLRHFLTLTCHGQPDGTRSLQRYLAAHQVAANSLTNDAHARLLQQLTWLEQPVPPCNATARARTHYWLSRHDALLPHRLCAPLQAQGLPTRVFNGSHGAFAAQQNECHTGDDGQPTKSVLDALQALATHMDDAPPAPRRKKSAVAKQFSRAASTYDQAGRVQQLSRAHLLQHLPASIHGHWLDIGCGTGKALADLQQRGAQHLIACDLAEGMLQHARTNTPASHSQHWLCADADALPLADASVDGVFSNLMLQWSENIEHTLSEWLRVLKPCGTLAISTLLDGTHKELAHAWQSIDTQTHVNQFLTARQWQVLINTLLTRHRLRLVAQTTNTHTEHYTSLNRLLRTLKAIGATNVNSGRPVGLGGRHALKQLDQYYPRQQTHEGAILPLSYCLHYLILQRTD